MTKSQNGHSQQIVMEMDEFNGIKVYNIKFIGAFGLVFGRLLLSFVCLSSEKPNKLIRFSIDIVITCV